MENKNKNYN